MKKPTKVPKRLLLTAMLMSTFLAPIAIGNSPASAVACDNWTGAVSTSFTAAGNWDGGVPTSSTDVCINGSLARQPSIASNTTVNSVTSTNNGTINFAAPFITLTLTSSSTIGALNPNFDTVSTGGVLTISGALTMSGSTILGAGSLVTTGDVDISGGNTIAVNWTLQSDKTTKNFTLNGNLATTSHTITVTEGSEFDSSAATGTPTLTTAGLISTGGDIDISGINVTGPVTLDTALLFFDKTITGSLTATDSTVVVNADGTPSVTASVTGAVTASGGEIDLNVNGPGAAGSTYDQLTVDGALTLTNDEQLSIDTPNSYTGTLGNAFDLIHAGSISGDFRAVDTDFFGNAALGAQASYTATDVTATVVNAPGRVEGFIYQDDDANGSLSNDETSPVENVTVFDDINNNGTKDQGEPSATSNSDGDYSLAPIPVGTAHIRTLGALPAGYAISTAQPQSVTVATGATTSNTNIGLTGPPEPSGGSGGGGDDPVSQGTGYWLVGSNGTVYSFGTATNLGSPSSLKLNAPIVGLAPSPQGGGYWAVGSDGGVFGYGTAGFYGSAGGIKLNKPVVGITSTPDGNGYFLVASDGGVFAYGDAKFAGSAGSIKLNQPIVGITATPDGGGYWLVAKDGGVFAYGDATFYGSMGAKHLNSPIVGITATADGGGYLLVAADGGVFAYGDATYRGGAANLKLNSPIVSIKAIADGSGYWLTAADGGVFAYGDAGFLGAPTTKVTGSIAQ